MGIQDDKTNSSLNEKIYPNPRAGLLQQSGNVMQDHKLTLKAASNIA